MQPHERYEIVDRIAQGDFATVYRARDKELGREVAIKQIHDQYLSDPKKLDRYWQEAQLLAKLEHPYIMTIYDIVRDRGWVVLELMQGSLPQKLAGNPIDLEDLRLTLIYMLHALSFLQKNGIIHGDVKPSNLLLDKNHRVKLGDFGIARRIAGDDGSVVKGTTKYIAPEVVSDQFGPVGPHSDLYSLGFAAYELMCGQHFDTLFPGLNMYGRDQQIAWMMWHSALDRRLPDIHRVLQGVPDELAQIVAKLSEKNPAKRYKTADEVVAQLRARDSGTADKIAEEVASAEQKIKTDRRKKMTLIGALAVSMCLSMAMMFFPSQSAPKDKPPVAQQLPTAGVVQNIDGKLRAIAIKPDDGAAVSLKVEAADEIRLNQSLVGFEQLRIGDRVQIKYGNDFKLIVVSRSAAEQAEHVLLEIDYKIRLVTLAPTANGPPGLKLFVPDKVVVQLNGETVELAKLLQGDRIFAQHAEGDQHRVATSLTALRRITVDGYVESYSIGKSDELTMRVGTADGLPRTFTLADDCEITINGKDTSGPRKLALSDLEAEDSVRITRDVLVHKIEVVREVSHTGVVRSVNTDGRWLQVAMGDPPQNRNFSLAATCQIAGVPASAEDKLAFIRPGDQVSIVQSTGKQQTPEALSITVTPKPNLRTWAIVIAEHDYVDGELPQLERLAADSRMMHDALVDFYRVPPSQMLMLTNPIRLSLLKQIEQRIAEIMAATQGAPATHQLVVYFCGYGTLGADGVPLLAARDFDSTDPTGTGLKLRDFLNLLEQCMVGEKILLLDTCHRLGDKAAGELPASLLASSARRVSSSVDVIASTSKGESAKMLGTAGAFPAIVTEALQGKADRNGDAYISGDELASYVVTGFGLRGISQTPQRFLPDATRARLTEETKTAVNKLLGYLQLTRVDDVSLQVDYELARQLQPQPDAEVAYGLIMLKEGRTRDAQRVFEKLLVDHPNQLVPYHALAWQYYLQKRYSQSIGLLAQLVGKLPKPDNEVYDAYARHVLEFAGTMRQHAVSALDPPLTFDETKPLDLAVKLRNDAAESHFLAGMDAVRKAMARASEQINQTADPVKQTAMRLDLRRVSFYANFDFEAAANAVQAGLDR